MYSCIHIRLAAAGGRGGGGGGGHLLALDPSGVSRICATTDRPTSARLIRTRDPRRASIASLIGPIQFCHLRSSHCLGRRTEELVREPNKNRDQPRPWPWFIENSARARSVDRRGGPPHLSIFSPVGRSVGGMQLDAPRTKTQSSGIDLRGREEEEQSRGSSERTTLRLLLKKQPPKTLDKTRPTTVVVAAAVAAENANSTRSRP